MLALGVMVGVFLGVYIGAFSITVPVGVDQSYRAINMTQQPVRLVPGQESVFNWLIFLLVFAPALVSSAVLFSGAEVCGAVARRTRTRTTNSSSGDDTITLGD